MMKFNEVIEITSMNDTITTRETIDVKWKTSLLNRVPYILHTLHALYLT